jgi:hypothetical protein
MMSVELLANFGHIVDCGTMPPPWSHVHCAVIIVIFTTEQLEEEDTIIVSGRRKMWKHCTTC